MKEILLIGNGPSALSMELGKEIDSFPIVARFNRFLTSGFEKNVGTKCDVWITCSEYLNHIEKAYSKVYFSSANQKSSEEKFLAFKQKVEKAEKFPPWAWEGTENKVGYTAPSTGAVAAFYFTHIYDKVYIYGFDFLCGAIHHYSDIGVVGPDHRPKLELAFFTQLIAEGKIIPFHDYLNHKEVCLTPADWNDSQRGELSFWNGQLNQGNIEQEHRNYYYRHTLEDGCNIFAYFFMLCDLSDKVLIDVGSGPQGILHSLKAKEKIAIDPLMKSFRDLGYGIEENNVKACAVSGEHLSDLLITADVIFCLNALDHTQNPQKVLDEVYSVLNKGGYFLLQTDIRMPEECDSLHKLHITEAWLHNALHKFKIEAYQIISHQAENTIMQFVALCKKE